MESKEVKEFAQILINEVRDKTISNSRLQMDEKSNSPCAKRWRSMNLKGNEELIKALVIDCVDQTIANLLLAIDQEILNLKFKASNNQEIELSTATDGLTGWYMGSEGWKEKYSKEHFFDDFKD